ncbi:MULTISPECIES: hypothetical protein [Acidithiobacillus]|uniref:hypothetical protein n=1 Tax=Acidithiobacillus ferrivorans TaxID=160808 RepID=UPI001C078AE8|nr:hypothetical protein [Acidithiobacillus ferrivorans]MBU2852317.1 hypothetical protein [Acidithiobacillus ferrivorans]
MLSHLAGMTPKKQRTGSPDAIPDANYGTPFRLNETPAGDLEPGKTPTSIAKSFKGHPDIAALSVYPSQNDYDRMRAHIRDKGILTPILLWRTTRTTTDERTITEYIVVDGYVRLDMAIDLKLPMQDIPWHVLEQIETLEQAIDYAAALKIHRAHLLPVERNYVIGMRYLGEKRRIGAPEGNNNAANQSALIYDNSDTDKENKDDILSPLNPGTMPALKTADRIATELGMNARSIYRYANAAEKIDIVINDIVRIWEIPRPKALRCCTQIELNKDNRDQVGYNPFNPRIRHAFVSSMDWEKAEVYPGILDRFTPQELDHYHERREDQARIAVRTILGDIHLIPRQISDAVYVEDAVIIEAELVDNVAPKTITLNEAERLQAEEDARLYAYFREGRRISEDRSIPEEERKRLAIPYEKAWGKRWENSWRDAAINGATQYERLKALRELRHYGFPLPTDELDREEEKNLRRAPRQILKDDPEMDNIVAVGNAWDGLATATENFIKGVHRYYEAKQELADLTDNLREVMETHGARIDRGEIEGVLTLDARGKRIQAGFLEIAKILVDTGARDDELIINKDRRVGHHTKSTLIKTYDVFKEYLPHIARAIENTNRFKSHKSGDAD